MDYKKMSFVSGVIVFFAFLILLFAIIWLSGNAIFFSRDYSVYIKFPDVVGLQDQSPVYMRGYRIGRVKDIVFEKDCVKVRIEINKHYKVPIESKFEINTFNMMGEKGITITPSRYSEQYIAPDTMVNGENRDIMIMAQNVLNTIKEKIESTALESKIRNFGDTLQSVATFSKKLDHKIGQIDLKFYNAQIKKLGEAGEGIRDFAKSSQQDLSQLASEGKESLKKMNQAVEKIADICGKVDSIATKVERGEGSAGELLTNKQYVLTLNDTLKELKDLVADFKKNPRKYIKLSIF